MAKYFHIATGMRGMYMPDNAYVVKVDSRRELKAIIASEARDFRDAGFVGASQKAIAWIANAAWKEAKKKSPSYLPYCLELAPPHAKNNYCHGIFVSTSDRADYLVYLEESE